MSEGTGTTDGAYFVSRTELLNWLNSTFGFNYTKVEQCCTAAAHCQVLDAIFPGTVAMDKVVWDAKSEYQYISNFKILQTALDRNGIKRTVDVQKLVKGKYQDNLELLQWIKAYFDLKKGTLEEGYDPIARRGVSSSAVPKKTTAPPPSSVPASTSSAKTALAARIASKQAVVVASDSTGSKRIEELEAQIAELEAQIQEDILANENLTKERDFYFRKLRDIEILCQTSPEPKPDIVQEVTQILYAVEEGFEGPNEAQE